LAPCQVRFSLPLTDAKEKQPALKLYPELLALMRRIVAEGRADEKAAKRLEYLATVRYAVPGPVPGRYTVQVMTDLYDPYVMYPPKQFKDLMNRALEIALPRDLDGVFMLIGAIPALRAEALHENEALPPAQRQSIEPWS